MNATTKEREMEHPTKYADLDYPVRCEYCGKVDAPWNMDDFEYPNGETYNVCAQCIDKYEDNLE